MQRRRHGRIRTPGVTANLHRGGDILAGLPVENLSLGGAFIRTARPLHEASRVGIVLIAPGSPRPLRLTGRVVSVTRGPGTSTGMGICFEGPSPETLSDLHALLMVHAPGPMVLDGDAPEAMEPARPAARPAPAGAVGAGPAAARLAVQMKWLLLELADWRAQASMLESRNQALQAEVERLLSALRVGVR